MSEINSNNGISTLKLLGISFFILKLTNVIDWSWWYITMPFWPGIILFILDGFSIYKSIKEPNSEIKKSKFQRKLYEAMKKVEKHKKTK